jgi:hypothetical protein
LFISGSGTSVVSPTGALWAFDVAGFLVSEVQVLSGDVFIGPTAEGTLSLNFSSFGNLSEFFPQTFNHNVVLSNIDGNGIAHTFAMTFVPNTLGSDIDIVTLTICQAVSEQSGNPNPVPSPH